MAAADERAAARSGKVRRDVERLRQTLEQLTTRAPSAASIQYILLDTASDISATPGVTLDATHLAPLDNWAQFSYRFGPSRHSDQAAVGFGFLWQNASDRYVVVNVSGDLILNGTCTALADSGGPHLPFDLHFCNLIVKGSLTIQELWHQPPTAPPSQPGQEWTALQLRAEANGIFDLPDIVEQDLYRGLFLGYEQLVVPPQGTVRIEVACVMTTFGRDAAATYDFKNFGDVDRQVLAPYVMLNVLP